MDTVTIATLPQSVVPDPALIATEEDAERWLTALHEAGLAWHPEDDAATVGNSVAGEWVRTFDDHVAILMNAWMDQVWKTGTEPCGFLLRLMGDYEDE